MPYRCPNCKTKLINYDGHILDQYCPKCSYEKDQDGKEHNKKTGGWVDY